MRTVENKGEFLEWLGNQDTISDAAKPQQTLHFPSGFVFVGALWE
jgi:hypothetical protein